MRWLLHHSADKGHPRPAARQLLGKWHDFRGIASVISLIPGGKPKPLSAAIGALPGSTPAGFCASQGSLVRSLLTGVMTLTAWHQSV